MGPFNLDFALEFAFGGDARERPWARVADVADARLAG